MNLFKTNLHIPLKYIVLGLLILLTGISYHEAYIIKDGMTANIFGGLCAGLIVAIIQMFMDWESFKSTDKLKKLKITEALVSRDDKIYYYSFIEKAQVSIDMMGVTGERFMRDFVDDDINASRKSKIVIDLIQRGVKVRILVPKHSYLEGENIKKGLEAEPMFRKIKQKFPNHFVVKYFNHVPSHSIFKIDDECIAGPVFPKLSSRYTPAIRFYNSSPVIIKYLEYFEDEWNNATMNFD